MRKFTIFMSVAIVTVMAGGLIARAFRPDTPEQKLLMAEKAIAQLYVDSVDENKMVEDAIRGMLEKLDPHSAYSTPEETRELNEPLQGNFSGIGITFNMNSDTLYVIQTVSGGPSERVGILAGDRIIAVNDSAIAGVKMKNSDVMKRLRGPKGTDVDVTVLRLSARRSLTPSSLQSHAMIFLSIVSMPHIWWMPRRGMCASIDLRLRRPRRCAML